MLQNVLGGRIVHNLFSVIVCKYIYVFEIDCLTLSKHYSCLHYLYYPLVVIFKIIMFPSVYLLLIYIVHKKKTSNMTKPACYKHGSKVKKAHLKKIKI